uniref:Uncharacterized protein n=1 Tax=Rhizophora mucronata TaxID=61149 RepID=A0A2P2KQS4_RHIMU
MLTFGNLLGMEKEETQWQVPTFQLGHVFDSSCTHLEPLEASAVPYL